MPAHRNRVSVVCRNCHKTVEVVASREKGFRFCCRSCWASYTNRGVPKSPKSIAKMIATKRSQNRTGSRAYNWRGGFTKDALGYIRNNVAGMYEHRRVMEIVLGRKLTATEIIHHKDGNKENNHPDNLEITNRAEHMRHHREELNKGRFRKVIHALVE